MSAGAFSDAKVVEASEKIVCIFVDCAWGKKNEDLSQRYKVRGYPTVVFCDPEGKLIDELGSDHPPDVAKQMLQIAGKYPNAPISPASPKMPEFSGKSLQESKKASKPLVLYVYDNSPPSVSVNLALNDALLKEMIGKFVWAKLEFRKGSELCAKFDVTRAPTILVLDASLEKPEEKPLARITGSRTARELQRELESALQAATLPPAPTTSKPSSSTPAPKLPEEKLSDDELDRRFIQARVSVAKDMIKRGMKEKAVEVLEDILKTYPKHVETLAAKKLLEEARK